MIRNQIDEEISLKGLIKSWKEWYSYFLSKWKKIAIVVSIGAVLGMAYSFTKKISYTATMSFVVEDDKSGGGLTGALGLASQFGFDIDGGASTVFSGNNLNELFKSRTMVEQTLLSPVKVNGKIISLAEMFIQDAKWRESWKKKPNLANIQFLPNPDRKLYTRIHDSILGVMYESLSKGSLSVSQKDKKISIITIDMSSNDELFAKYFCENLANQVSEFYVTTKSKKARMNMAVLERQSDSIRSELNNAITGVAVANDNTFGLNPALNVRRTPSAKRQVDVQANSAILTELVKQTELAKVALRRETPLIQIIDRPILPLKKEKFGKAKGILYGGFIAGFLIVLILLVKKIFNDLLLK